MGYVYIRSEPQLYTVGHYDPAGAWHAESDWCDSERAAERVAWLNGSHGRHPSEYYTAVQRAIARDIEGAAGLMTEAADLLPEIAAATEGTTRAALGAKATQVWNDLQSFRHNKGDA